MNILQNKYYGKESLFKPENLLREAKRQKGMEDCNIPAICLLDPDGDLLRYLLENKLASKNNCWACYHSSLYDFTVEGYTIGILPCVVGASYAVLVAEQLFVSGCRLLLSVTSAGIINHQSEKRFALITRAVRDEGTSYHYLPPEQKAALNEYLLGLLTGEQSDSPFFPATSWTTDAPYRETEAAIEATKNENICCVEMEAAALYAFAQAKYQNVICFAHLTNTMAQSEGDFEKGEHFGSIDTLQLVSWILKALQPANIF